MKLLARLYLTWMFDHHPQLAREMDRERRLASELDASRLRMFSALRALQADGLNHQQAYQAMRESLLTKPQPPQANPMPLAERQAILRRLRAVQGHGAEEMQDSLREREREHLEWMFENHPEHVRVLYRAGKLRQLLTDKEQQALRAEEQMLQAGLAPDQAREVVSNQILSPPDGPAMMDDPAPEPLPLKEQEAILKRLETFRG